MTCRAILLSAVLAFQCWVLPAFAGEIDGEKETLNTFVTKGLAALNAGSRSDVLREALGDPDTVSNVVNSFVARSSGWQFLRDIDFKLKVFRGNQADSPTSLGFSYNFQRSLKDVDLSPKDTPTTARGFDLNFRASGNVAFDRDVNPEDFLDTKADFGFYQSIGGATPKTGETDEDKKAEKKRLDELVDKMAKIKTKKQLLASAELKEYLRTVRGQLSDQYYFDVAAEGGIESNQSFSKKQYVYGGKVGLDAKGWGDKSTLAQLNIVDYPFALVRYLTNYDPDAGSFRTLGTSIPTAILGLAYVDPQDNDPRAMAGDKSGFPRFRTEVSFKTPIAQLMDSPVYFAANYRIYQEIDAKGAVRAQHLDRFEYFVATLSSGTGVFVSYSTGRLPFDAKDDQIYQIGWQFHLM